jgi:hypothetical protein
MKNYSYSKYSKDLANKANLISLISKRNAYKEFDVDEYITIQNKLKSPEVSNINEYSFYNLFRQFMSY